MLIVHFIYISIFKFEDAYSLRRVNEQVWQCQTQDRSEKSDHRKRTSSKQF